MGSERPTAKRAGAGACALPPFRVRDAGSRPLPLIPGDRDRAGAVRAAAQATGQFANVVRDHRRCGGRCVAGDRGARPLASDLARRLPRGDLSSNYSVSGVPPLHPLPPWRDRSLPRRVPLLAAALVALWLAPGRARAFRGRRTLPVFVFLTIEGGPRSLRKRPVNKIEERNLFYIAARSPLVAFARGGLSARRARAGRSRGCRCFCPSSSTSRASSDQRAVGRQPSALLPWWWVQDHWITVGRGCGGAALRRLRSPPTPRSSSCSRAVYVLSAPCAGGASTSC